MALNLAYNKTKLQKTLDYWSKDMFNIDVLEKDLEIVPSTHSMFDFSIKMFLLRFSINWLNYIIWFPLLFSK